MEDTENDSSSHLIEDTQIENVMNCNLIEGSMESTGSHTFSRRRRCMNSLEVENIRVEENYESLDYDTCINAIWQEQERKQDLWFVMQKNIMRWVIAVAIGVLTALVACCIDISIESLSYYKYSWLQYFMDRGIKENTTYITILLWLVLNVFPTILAAVLGSYIEPMAAGSGIPQIKCYLNGVKVPRVVRLKTLFAKIVGVICSVLGGLIVGKEGPMIHSGAVIAAGISQGKSSSFNCDFKIFKYFREDKEKRDFVSAGAAAGVAAAFGAPIGGLLFALEEGASFWNQYLTWRVLFNAMVTTFTLNLALSAYKGLPGQLANNGLLNLGKFDDLTYTLPELLIFIMIASICGLLGAAFNALNCRLTIFRLKHIKTPFRKTIEAIFMSCLTLCCALIMVYSMQDCRDIDQGLNEDLQAQVFCASGKESAVADLWLKTPEGSVRSLFHSANGSYHWATLLVFSFVFFFLACITYGLGVPSGLFIPSLLVGGTIGRLLGVCLGYFFPNQPWVDEGKYALVGAAAMLAGVVRMTLSLTVILMECIGNITFVIPLMIVVIVSKWIGDCFNEGLYDIHIHLMKAPILGWEPPPLGNRIFAVEVMNKNVVTLKASEKVGNIYKTLARCTHNGFPVVEIFIDEMGRPGKRLKGLILRSQLIVLLMNKVFNNSTLLSPNKVGLDIFRDDYPRYSKLEDVHLNHADMGHIIDLRPFMNPAPYTVYSATTLPRIFRIFRALGLRHLIVIDYRNSVVGMVTRQDLAKFEGLVPNSQRSVA